MHARSEFWHNVAKHLAMAMVLFDYSPLIANGVVGVLAAVKGQLERVGSHPGLLSAA